MVQRGCDFSEEAVVALNKMIEEKIVWEPGTVDGNPVDSHKTIRPKIHIE